MVSKKGLEKKKCSSALVRLTDKLIKDKLFKCNLNETLFLPCTTINHSEHVLLVGTGDAQKIDEESIRQASASAYKCLENHSVSSAVVDTTQVSYFIKNPFTIAKLISEGFALAHYQFNDLKQKNTNKAIVKDIYLTGLHPEAEFLKGLEEGICLAKSTNFARWLADHPANLMTPSILGQSVQNKFKKIKNVKVNIWNKDRIKREKMGGLLGVSLGSNQEPRVIIIEYNGQASSKKQSPPIYFVGKGLTFDSGGISLKPANSMDEMKFDMCGAVAVIGALLAIASLKLKVHAVGIVGASENMPGAAANKPGDILKARNGKTMDVLNTDAEGRLVLADILSYVSEQKPAFIIDAATLTGAVVVALGNIYTGLFTRNDNLKELILKASQISGERMWPLPLDDHHVKDVKGIVGDVANISSTRGAGSSTAAAFLEQFVGKNIPWAHLDIAGTAYNVSNRLSYCRPKTASGVMVRTFVEICRQHIR